MITRRRLLMLPQDLWKNTIMNPQLGSPDDLNALAELSNSKVEKLAEISNQGVSEMATLMQKNGDEYSVYEEWSLKVN